MHTKYNIVGRGAWLIQTPRGVYQGCVLYTYIFFRVRDRVRVGYYQVIVHDDT